MFFAKNPNPNSNEDSIIYLNVDYLFGDNWVECGISRVNGYITSLGFNSRIEMKAFCKTVNIFEVFSNVEWIRGFISFKDAGTLIYQNSKGISLGGNTIAAGLDFEDQAELAGVKDGVIPDHSSYAVFYQILFSWFTKWDNGTNREKFISWWKDTDNIQEKPHRDSWAYHQVVTHTTAPVLNSFQVEVNNFISGTRSPKYEQPGIAEAIHGIESAIIGLALKPSKWKYVSGDDINIVGETPILNLGAGGGAGYYYFYSDDSPNIYYPVRFGHITFSIGANMIPTAVSGSINLAFLPAFGTLYQGWQNINSVSDLQGLYFYISGSAGVIGNVNNSLICFLPVGNRIAKNIKEAFTDSALLAATILTNVATSKAIMITAANGLESIVGAGASVGYGYAHVGTPIKKSQSHWNLLSR